MYVGTRTGEVLEVILKSGRYTRNGPVGKIFRGGVNVISSTFSQIMVGCQNGTLAKMDKKTFLFIEEAQLGNGPVFSLANSAEKLYALTAKGTLHSIQGERSMLANQAMFMSSVSNPIEKIVFPVNYSDVFACLTKSEIRIFSAKSLTELLQIKLESEVEGLTTANCIEFMADGKSIVTGWSDGKVRAFLPQSGRLLYVIDSAHSMKPTKSRELPPSQDFKDSKSGVICLAVNQYSDQILTGGFDASVSLW